MIYYKIIIHMQRLNSLEMKPKSDIDLEEFSIIDSQALMISQSEKVVEKIESDMLIIYEIMRDINCITHNQGELVNNIEQSITNAQTSVAYGISELSKASEIQPSYVSYIGNIRKFIGKLFF